MWLVVCFFGLFAFPSLVIAECEYFIDMSDGWCCPTKFAQMLCWESLDRFNNHNDICYSLGCYPDHIGRIKRKRDERKARQRRPCERCQERDENGYCEKIAVAWGYAAWTADA